MKKTALLLILIIPTFLYSSGKQVDLDPFINEGLTALKMHNIDLSVLSLISGPFRMSLIDSSMHRPLEMPYLLDSLGIVLSDNNTSAFKVVEASIRLTDNEIEQPVAKSVSEEYPWKGKKEIPVRLRNVLDIIFASFEQASVEFTAAFSSVDSFQMDSLEEWGLNYLSNDAEHDIDSEQGETSLEDFDESQLEIEKLTDRIFNISTKINRAKIASAYAITFKAALSAAEKSKGLTAKNPSEIDIPDSIASGDVIYWCETDRGLVVIGGPRETVYRKRAAVILDLGGNDFYLSSAGGADPQNPFAVCIDLGGNDSYISDEPFAFGSGGMGIGVLIDYNGNDLYLTDNMGIACGCYGAGILVDKAGDDEYSGKACTQGCGFLGWGTLLDKGGNDKYSSTIFSQGFGYIGGLGLLIDTGGNDNYISQGTYSNKLSYTGHYLSLSQGFGLGNRPDWSGGIGFLFDRSGDDNYIADIFSQGSSYWLALGGLWDGGGNDSYIGFQYSQGTATHLSAAILLDKTGDDSYCSHGVSQGSGHDLAVGYFLDLDGNDNYIVHDLSQGTGNANGVGVFIDFAGNDNYTARNEYNVQGYGNWNRDFGSIGLMLDCAGDDNFSGKGNNSSWWGTGKYGIGIDFPANLEEKKQ
ncbi:hypothetical protein KAH81_01485 [bacterium]|nr:hypothetical protein [bacterium]